MLELLLVYKWTLLGGSLSAGALALIGCQLASRGQATQTLAVGQAASLGVSLGLVIAHALGGHEHEAASWQHAIPTVAGVMFAAAAYAVAEAFVPARWGSRDAYHVGLLTILMSLTYGVIAIAPGLESHVAASYFGDVSVATDAEAIATAALGLLAGGYVWLRWRLILSWSFDSAVFAVHVTDSRTASAQRGFLVLSLASIAASVQVLGILFTVACLFLPVLFLSRSRASGAGLRARLVGAAALGTFVGFVASLASGRLPTTPTIVVCVALCSAAAAVDVRRRA